MIALISPAKKLNYDKELPTTEHTIPDGLENAAYLIKKLKKLSKKKIISIMGLSEALASLNHDRYQQWELPFTPENARQAILAFDGEVYWGIEAYKYSNEDFDFAQKRLRILSGLHGLLRPLDLIQPYRLEMGTKWNITPKIDTLYKYWGNQITDQLNDLLKEQQSDTLINLASNEYFKSVNQERLNATIITCHFKQLKNGEYKALMTYAKRARGFMASFMIQNKLESVDDLKSFDTAGYYFNEQLSKENDWVFTRDSLA